MRCWFLFWAASMYGQVTTASVSGYVLYPVSASIAKAEITITQPNRGWVRTAFSNDEGRYEFTELTPAAYTISVKAEAFWPATADVRVAVNSQVRTDFHMMIHAGD